MNTLALAQPEVQSNLLIEDLTASAAALPGFSNHERILVGRDDERGLTAIIAIHDTTLGPALGGTRIWMHHSFDESMADALQLSRRMSYKAAIAGLPFGGGKAVIRADPRRDKTPALMEAYAEMLGTVQSDFITAEDVGMSLNDADFLRKRTANVAGTSEGGSGNPVRFSAHGVYLGIRAALLHRTGSDDLEGTHVAIQGLGSVGMALAEKLHHSGARLTVSDLDAERAWQAAKRFNAAVAEADAILETEADILAPCALGGVITLSNLVRLRARIIAGSAHQPLSRPEVAVRLQEQGVLYAPDFVINAGGLINVASELDPDGYDSERVMERIAVIPDTLMRIFEESSRTGRTPGSIAIEMAEQKIADAREQNRG